MTFSKNYYETDKAIYELVYKLPYVTLLAFVRKILKDDKEMQEKVENIVWDLYLELDKKYGKNT